ncbi:hypothetical protein PMAYCL1PPCAC_23358, partial [Pristionchus mayeri]
RLVHSPLHPPDANLWRILHQLQEHSRLLQVDVVSLVVPLRLRVAADQPMEGHQDNRRMSCPRQWQCATSKLSCPQWHRTVEGARNGGGSISARCNDSRRILLHLSSHRIRGSPDAGQVPEEQC